MISAIIADLLIVIIWNFFRRNSSSLILQLRTKEHVPLTSPGDYQKNFLLTRKVHLIYFLAENTDSFIILSLRKYLFFYYTLSFTCLFILIKK